MAKISNVFSKEEVKKTAHPKRITKWIHYTKLTRNEKQYCDTKDIEEIEGLADLIEASGMVLQDLLVKKLDSDEYQIIAGHKRCAACKLLVEERGKKEFEFLPCFEQNISDVRAEFQVYSTNCHHEETPYETMHKLERMQYLINNYPDEFPEIQGGRMVDRLAKKYNLSKSTVGEYLSIFGTEGRPMKMVKYKHILTVVCAMAALGTSTVYAADTTITDSDLVMDEMIGSAGEQVLPDSTELEQVDKARTGSIQVELTDGKAGTEKSNIKISCQKVADIVQGEYVLIEEYEHVEVDLNAIETSNDLKDAAEKLVAESGNNATMDMTDASGIVTFNNLEVGVYLIYVEDSETYDTVDPSLIAIPTWSDSDEDMLYDVVITPKHTEKPDKENNVAPQTNLEDSTWKYAGAAGICVLGAVVCMIRMRKRKG